MTEAQTGQPAEGGAISTREAATAISSLLNKPDTEQESQEETPATEAESTPETDDTGSEQDTTEPEDKDGESEPKSEDSDAELYEVTLPGGEKAKVTLEELAKGYSREADYTRNKMKLSQELSALQAKQAEYEQVVQQKLGDYEARLADVDKFLEGSEPLITPEQWAEWEQYDPARFAAEKIKYQERQEQRHAVKAKRERVRNERQQAEQQRLAEFVQSQIPLVKQYIPEANDPQKWAQKQQEMRGFLNEIGFTDQEIGSIYDARILKVVNEAIKSRSVVQKQQVVAKKVAEAPRMVTPSASPSKGERSRIAVSQAKERLNKTGSVRDAANVLKHFI